MEEKEITMKFTKKLPKEEKFQNALAYQLLEQDLKNIFEYVEPTEDNAMTYSHRIYELFFRACTEYESVCKQIMKLNGINKEYSKINDYFKIGIELKFYEYCLSAPFMGKLGVNISPFMTWGGHATYTEYFADYNANEWGDWYQDYNKVKHNRENNFYKANLHNAIMSIAGLAVTLYSQYGFDAFDPYHENVVTHYIDNNVEFVPLSMWSFSCPDMK